MLLRGKKKSLLYGEAFEGIMNIRQFIVLVVLLGLPGLAPL